MNIKEPSEVKIRKVSNMIIFMNFINKYLLLMSLLIQILFIETFGFSNSYLFKFFNLRQSSMMS